LADARCGFCGLPCTQDEGDAVVVVYAATPELHAACSSGCAAAIVAAHATLGLAARAVSWGATYQGVPPD
jgi:hypothetical protein